MELSSALSRRWPALSLKSGPSSIADRQKNRDHIIVASIIAGVVLLRIGYVFTTSLDNVVYRLTDDSYYYFNTARNIVLGFGITFDRINSTNGFHPLWLLCLLPVYALVGTEIEIPIRIISALLAIVAGLTMWIAYRVIDDWLGRWAAFFALAMMWHPVIINNFLNGLETGLLILLVFLAVRLDQRWEVTSGCASVVRSATFGGVLGLMFLSRLDSIFLVLCIFAMWLLHCVSHSDRSRSGSRRWLGITMAATVCGGLGGAYLLWDYLWFGHLMPISGALKSSFPTPIVSLRTLTKPHVFVHAVGVIGFWMLLVWTNFPRLSAPHKLVSLSRSGKMPALFIPLWLGCTVHFLYELLFTKWGLEWWHFASHVAPRMLLGALVFALFTKHVTKPIIVSLVLLAAIISGTFSIVEIHVRGAHHEPWLRAAEWAKIHTPADAVFAMTDSGFFGYFSERRTVNLDGVINSYAFQQVLRDGRLSAFLHESGVTYLADYEVPSPVSEVYRIHLRSGLFDQPGGELIVTPAAEVYRSAPYTDYVRALKKRGQVSFIIWDFTKINVLDSAA
jgi:hypothetical protein